ncbi:hypothetical protein [Saccharibacillus alkalitolerans]|uniref:Uncharacterized protein n=1 Tax=Saccharibacillus alkalitolerans TaxID=2705290 RepID=A0ABX0FDL7_9BACL|nr:hypothetical protein [Saccharibacillus alkalitolerans]NGZ77913.1 hypothetical protein [Saccharibacillus alkalitolerans]
MDRIPVADNKRYLRLANPDIRESAEYGAEEVLEAQMQHGTGEVWGGRVGSAEVYQEYKKVSATNLFEYLQCQRSIHYT